MSEMSETVDKKSGMSSQSVCENDLKQRLKQSFEAHYSSAEGIVLQLLPQYRPPKWMSWKRLLVLLISISMAIGLLVFLLIPKSGFPSESQLISQHSQQSAVLSQSLALQADPTTTTTTTTIPPVRDLLITVVALNATVPQMDKTWFSQRADAYVELCVLEGTRLRRIGRSPADQNTRSPKWNYMFDHETRVRSDAILQFELIDKDRWNADESIAKVFVKLDQLVAEKDGNGRVESRPFKSGRIWFTVHWREVLADY
ncbi:uncharacterized protein LOC128956400 [Oppia nitens]|uniref:uncharacterized protein LOC128956400 n=1 Tax=Oppia nitens TaxID=1686743 RepID=UPI0023DB0867|nr:uncharacterized protein LOC128956400 [Oppia nitens]